MSDLVRGPHSLASPWVILPDEPQGSQAIALAFDDHILAELLDASRVLSPGCIWWPNHPSSTSLKASILDSSRLHPWIIRWCERVIPGATSLTPWQWNTTTALYEAIMGASRNWHASLLVWYLYQTASHTCEPGASETTTFQISDKTI